MSRHSSLHRFSPVLASLALFLPLLAPCSAQAGAQATFYAKLHGGARSVPRSVLVVTPLTTATSWAADTSTTDLPEPAKQLAQQLIPMIMGELEARRFRAEWIGRMPFDLRAALEECIRSREPNSRDVSVYSPRNDLLEGGRYRLDRKHTGDLLRMGTEAVLYVEAHAQELTPEAKERAHGRTGPWKGPKGSHCVMHWWLVETRGGLLLGHGQARRAGWVSTEAKPLAARVSREALAPLDVFKGRLPRRR